MERNFYLKILRWGIYLVLVLPLFVSAKFFYPFVFPRTVIFRIIIEVLFIFYLLLILKFPQYRPKPNLFFWSIVILTAVFVLTAITSLDPAKSFLGSMERGNGVFTWLHYFVFFIILVSVFKEKKDWLKIFNLSVAVSLIVSLYALGQRLGLPSLIESGVDRATGTIGNAAFLASYLILSIGLILILLVSRINSGLQTLRQAQGIMESRIWKIFYFSALFFNLLALYLTQTRGAVLALIAGFFIFSLLYIIFVPQQRLMKKYLIISLILFIILGASLWFFKDQPFIDKIPGLSRLTTISLKETTAQTRLLAWQTSWQGWKERFLFGWGPDNYNIVFNKHFNPEFYKYGRGETWFDRAHNIVFDVATTSGLIGLLAYLSVFAVGFWLLWKKIKENPLMTIILATLLIAYFFQNLFVFDVFNSYLLFFLVLGYVYFFAEQFGGVKESLSSSTLREVSSKGQRQAIRSRKSFQVKPGRILVMIILFLIIPLSWQLNFKPLMADYWSAQAYKNAQNPKTKEALLDLQKANSVYENILKIYQKTLSYQAYGDPEIRLDLANFVFLNTENKQISSALKEKGFNFAIDELKKSIKAHPADARWHLFIAKLYQAYAQTKSIDNQDNSELLKESERFVRDGIDLSSKRIALHYVLVQTLLMEEKYQEALDRVKSLIPLYPKMPDTYWYLSLAYLGIKDETSSLKAIDQALDYGYSFQNIGDLTLAASLYSKKENLPRLEMVYKQAISLEPKNPQWYASLATVYARLGDKEKARETALRILEINPELKEQVEEFLKNL